MRPHPRPDSRDQPLGELRTGIEHPPLGVAGLDEPLDQRPAVLQIPGGYVPALLLGHGVNPTGTQIEPKFLGRLQHPGIAPVYELGQCDDRRPCFTMKLVKGRTLAAILAVRRDTTEDRMGLLGTLLQVRTGIETEARLSGMGLDPARKADLVRQAAPHRLTPESTQRDHPWRGNQRGHRAQVPGV